MHTDVIFQCHSLKGLSFLSLTSGRLSVHAGLYPTPSSHCGFNCCGFDCCHFVTDWAQETPAPSLLFLLTVLWLFRSFDNLCELRFLFLVLQMIFLGFWSWLYWICRSLGIQRFKYWINSSDLWNDPFTSTCPNFQRTNHCLFLGEWFLWLLLWNHFFNSLNSDHLQHINTHLSNLKLYKVPIFWMLYIDGNHLQT